MTRIAVLLLLVVLRVWAADPFLVEREKMVREQIAQRGIRNPDVLRVMRAVPRHRFVPHAGRSRAYFDGPQPIGHGATISQPYIVGLMTELLEPTKTQKVLEIGTGSGYQAAVLSQLVDHVFSIEIVPELARSAAETLSEQGYTNVTVRQGDGYRGWPDKAPFDRIIITAAPSEIPQALVDQLRPGGKLVVPVGRTVWDQNLVVVDKGADGKTRQRRITPVAFVPMVQKDVAPKLP